MMTPQQRECAIDGAARYALADASDPFTFARCMMHIRQGICDPKILQDGSMLDCIYNADRNMEMRKLPDSREYLAPVYKNGKRP